MREILFRGKRVDSGEWVYWNIFGEYTEPFGCETDMHSYVSRCDIIPETVGRYTGLTDKNGVKIFEGEIVNAVYSVPYEGKKHTFTSIPIEDITDYKQIELLNRSDLVEIIGNIHDNPELLKVED